MLSSREALAGGCAFLGIVLVIVRAASVRRADEIRARCSVLGQRSRCRAADGAISGDKVLICAPITAGSRGHGIAVVTWFCSIRAVRREHAAFTLRQTTAELLRLFQT